MRLAAEKPLHDKEARRGETAVDAPEGSRCLLRAPVSQEQQSCLLGESTRDHSLLCVGRAAEGRAAWEPTPPTSQAASVFPKDSQVLNGRLTSVLSHFLLT